MTVSLMDFSNNKSASIRSSKVSPIPIRMLRRELSKIPQRLEFLFAEWGLYPDTHSEPHLSFNLLLVVSSIMPIDAETFLSFSVHTH